jgi:hypothetical protein
VHAYLNGDARASFWHRAEVVRQVLGEGRAEAALLAEEDRLLLEDLEERARFFARLQRRTRQMKRTKLAALLDRTSLMTHLLPVIVDDAARDEAEGPRFGGAEGGEADPGPDALLAAAERMERRTPEERKVLFEDCLRRAEREEASAVEAPVAAPPPAPLPSPLPPKAVRDEREARRHLEAGLAAERQEDGKWFRRKDYTAALASLRRALELGHPDAAEAVLRVEDKAT